MCFEYSENRMVRETIDGCEIIEAVWVDTCPYNPEANYCVCQANIEFDDNVTDLASACDYFEEHCLYNSFCVKDRCSEEEALQFIQEWIRKED